MGYGKPHNPWLVGGFSKWNMVILCFWVLSLAHFLSSLIFALRSPSKVFFRAPFTDLCGFIKTFLPFAVVCHFSRAAANPLFSFSNARSLHVLTQHTANIAQNDQFLGFILIMKYAV